jgi:sugar phosphate permease
LLLPHQITEFNMGPEIGASVRSGPRWLPKFLWPPPAAPKISDPARIERGFQFFRPRILFWTTVGYGTFYFVRKNLPVAMPVLEKDLGISRTSLGLYLTLHGVLYGVSKFLNGVVGDRADGRKFMALGLSASAFLNIAFGLGPAIIGLGIVIGWLDVSRAAAALVVFFGVVWMINGWFQGMGFPPCARLLAHWFSPKELATKMSFWNASHSIGAAGILILCGYLLNYSTTETHPMGDWRLCFYVPAGIALAVAVALWLWLRDTPESVGLPEIEGTHVSEPTPEAAQTGKEFRAFLWKRVFSDKYIWIVSAANFFVYVLRYSIFDWGPTMLKDIKGVQLVDSAWMVAGFEFAGLAGMITTGWLTDRYFRGRAAPLCVVSMLLAAGGVYLLWHAPAHNAWINTSLMCALGFLIYGPQALVAIIVIKLATKRAAATAVGLTSIFGYASTTLSGIGVGWLSKQLNWQWVFGELIAMAVIGAILFAAAIPANVQDYSEPVPE